MSIEIGTGILNKNKEYNPCLKTIFTFHPSNNQIIVCPVTGMNNYKYDTKGHCDNESRTGSRSKARSDKSPMVKSPMVKSPVGQKPYGQKPGWSKAPTNKHLNFKTNLLDIYTCNISESLPSNDVSNADSPRGARMTYSCWKSRGATSNVPSMYHLSALAKCVRAD